HIIQVDRIQPAEIKARHILVTVAISDSELAAARRTADTVAARLHGNASFDSLALLFADTSEPRVVGPLDRTQLPAPFVQAFEGAAAGEVVGPFAMNPETPARSRFAVAEVTDVQPERAFNFEEVREQLRANVLQQKAISELLRTLRRQVYLDIRL
ncbi:MAG: peptidyl-prolyl cis-trans isomerase, partial [Gemmatimonadales bacterium]|nr:peptidyl-prolyl cis-trans isomerase [Gemmatimonadales bacterium]